MTYIYIILAAIIMIVLSIIYEEYKSRFCKNCKAKMNRHYDPEEDCEVYQCPCCGRSYIIK